MVAAPSLGTLGTISSLDEAAPGLHYSEVWGEYFYETLYPNSPDEQSHIPSMALLSGKTQELHDFHLRLFLRWRMPSFFEAELLVGSIKFGGKQLYRAFYFPLAANAPTCMMLLQLLISLNCSTS
jgi:hypothetical protein